MNAIAKKELLEAIELSFPEFAPSKYFSDDTSKAEFLEKLRHVRAMKISLIKQYFPNFLGYLMNSEDMYLIDDFIQFLNVTGNGGVSDDVVARVWGEFEKDTDHLLDERRKSLIFDEDQSKVIAAWLKYIRLQTLFYPWREGELNSAINWWENRL